MSAFLADLYWPAAEGFLEVFRQRIEQTLAGKDEAILPLCL